MSDADLVFLKKSLIGLLFRYLLYISNAPAIKSFTDFLPFNFISFSIKRRKVRLNHSTIANLRFVPVLALKTVSRIPFSSQ